MKSWIALFKGINVGGNNIVPMKGLVEEFNSLGFTSVKSYIQSGNVVFQSAEKNASKLSKVIENAVHTRFGIRPPVIVLSKKIISDAIDANPFDISEADAAKLHLFFLFSTSTEINKTRLAALQKPNERCELINDVFYLHAPDGAGQSNLAVQVEKIVGVPVTARNWRTVCTINTMLTTLD